VIPRCQFVELEGVGHVPQIEAFQRFITPVKGFLNAEPLRMQARK
jgi:hypothetical protein